MKRGAGHGSGRTRYNLFMKILKRFIAPFILISIIFTYFFPAVTGQQSIFLGDYTGSDLLDLHYPFRHFITGEYRASRFPLWTQDLDMGYPLLAEGQSGPLYPLHLLLLSPPPLQALNLSIVITLIIAGIGTYIFCRSLSISKTAALLSGISFAFSGVFIARLKHVNYIEVNALIPWAFFCAEMFCRTSRPRWLILLFLVYALAILAGSPNMTFILILGSFVYLVVRLIKTARTSKTIVANFFFFLPIGIALTFLLTAAQILPSLELAPLTVRSKFSLSGATGFPFTPDQLLNFVLPYRLGNPAVGTYQQNLNAKGVWWENAVYFGLIPLVLSFYAIWKHIRRNTLSQRQTYLILAALSLFFLIVALGNYGFLFQPLWESIPVLQFFRFPSRFLLVTVFGLTVLAGHGLDLLLPPRSGDRRPTLLAIITAVDLLFFTNSYVAFIKADFVTKPPESLATLPPPDGTFRIYTDSPYFLQLYPTKGWKNIAEIAEKVRNSLPPNTNLLWGFSSISDRTWFEGGLDLARRTQVENHLLELFAKKDNLFPAAKFLGLYNTKYFLTYKPVDFVEFKKIKELGLGDQFQATLHIYENNQFYDRVRFVPEAVVIKNEPEILPFLSGYSFYPQKSVLLEEDPPLPDKFMGNLDEFHKQNLVTASHFDEQKIELKTSTEIPAYLVLADTYYPGWRAAVDGVPTKIYRANYVNRAVAVDPGEHTVEFSYQPESFARGLNLTRIGIVLFVILLGTTWVYEIVQRKREL